MLKGMKIFVVCKNGFTFVDLNNTPKDGKKIDE